LDKQKGAFANASGACVLGEWFLRMMFEWEGVVEVSGLMILMRQAV
jgi:hypothetical protein